MLFRSREIFTVTGNQEGHGGGDERLRKQVFEPGQDPYNQSAGSRDGAMACLIGIAARNSIDSGQPVKIASLTSITPTHNRK